MGIRFSKTYYKYFCRNRDEEKPAVIIFTSGTEGEPKAVMLSHRNLQANRYQATAKILFSPDDIVFNSLPLFHCLGLGGAIITTLNGIKLFYIPHL